MEIKVHNLKSLTAKHDISGRHPAGEQAYLVSEVVINQELVRRLPHTALSPLTSDHANGRHTYEVSVRGYTVDQFVAVVAAFAASEFDEAERLIAEITPRNQWDD